MGKMQIRSLRGRDISGNPLHIYINSTSGNAFISMELTDATTVFVAAHVTTFNVHCKLIITCSQQLIMK